MSVPHSFTKTAITCSLALALAAASTANFAQSVQGPGTPIPGSSVARGDVKNASPLNTAVSNSRALVADGSSVTQFWPTGDAQKWYSLDIEPGKTYVIEVFDPYNDDPAEVPFGLGVYDSDGTTTPPTETTATCDRTGVGAIAPSISSHYGYRCVVRAFYPAGGLFANTLNRRSIFIQVFPFSTNKSFAMRASESTIYGRWTTNGYDFHIELQNTTGSPICVQPLLYPNSGTTYNGPSPALAGGSEMTIPAYGANKVIVPAGTTVNGDNRGTLRIHACFASPNLVGNALHVSTYAFNPVTNQYLYFFPWKANGSNGNSF